MSVQRFTAVLRALTAHAWRLTIFVVGLGVVLLGIVLLPLPGPGTAVVAIGLAILSVEFVWARQWLGKLKAAARRVGDVVSKSRNPQPAAAAVKRRRPLRIRRPTAR